MREEILQFTKKDGHKIAGKTYIPDGSGRFPTVIFSHGFGGDYRCLMHHGPEIAEAGITCIFFDFCGGGMKSLSDGKMTDMTPLTEVEDLTAVMEEAVDLEYVDPDNLFLMGESMGGFVSAYVAAQNSNRVKGLILWYPAFVIPDDSRKRLESGNNVVFGMKIDPAYDRAAVSMNIWEKIGRYKGPVHIIHGDADEVVPLSYSERAAGIYEEAELTVMPGAGHGFEGDDSVNARAISIDFIMSHADRLLFTIDVNCKENISVMTEKQSVNQVFFDGTAEGKYFNGKILPGGADTQTYDAEGKGHLSARYILEGKDDSGKDCRIFIDNEAEMGGHVTSPSMITDSKSLGWLMDEKLYGLIDDRDGLKIKIFCRLSEYFFNLS